MVNISEGRDEALLGHLARSCGSWLIDLHRDPWHHRAVLTLAGPANDVEGACRVLATETVAALDLRRHSGAHPRLGVLDVVPFVPLTWLAHDDGPSRPDGPGGARSTGPGGAVRVAAAPDLGPAVAARDAFTRWAGHELGLPCFRYGPLGDGTFRTLPEVRRGAFRTLAPDAGPATPHPTAGAAAVGARPVLVAYNVWLRGGDVTVARTIAAAIRSRTIRALGFDLGGVAQVSCNLLEPGTRGPAQVYDEIARRARGLGAQPDRAELVGLLPGDVLREVPEHRWGELGLRWADTLEARLEGLARSVSWR